MSSFSNPRATDERIFSTVGLLVKLIEQARVVFVHPRYYSNVVLKPVVRSLLSFLISLLAKMTI